jgi:hypothetical protein
LGKHHEREAWKSATIRATSPQWALKRAPGVVHNLVAPFYAALSKGSFAMKIIRGTFRLSILIALLVAAYYGIHAYMAGVIVKQENRRLAGNWTTLRCAERFLGQDMSRYTNEAGLIDIGGAGCSDRPFLATFEEIREAVASPASPSLSLGAVYRDLLLYGGLFAAVVAFMLVNLVGFVLLGARGVFRWVRAGYR